MKPFFCLLMSVLVVAVGITGCKNSQKAAKKEPTPSSTVMTKKDNSDAGKEPMSGSDARVQTRQEPANPNQNKGSFTTKIVTALPNVIIYKTQADYSKNVPVGLNNDKTAIISYPGKFDLKNQMPRRLEYDFLLDYRGINLNVAFLKYTYEEYLNLEEIPSIAELFDDIIDFDPLIEMYHCGKSSNFQQGVPLEEQLNKILKKSEGNPEQFFIKLK